MAEMLMSACGWNRVVYRDHATRAFDFNLLYFKSDKGLDRPLHGSQI